MQTKVLIYKKTGVRLLNQGISNNGLSIYLALKSLTNPHMTRLSLNLESIFYQISDKPLSRQDKINISNSIDELTNIGLIKILDKAKDNYLLDLSNLLETDEIEVSYTTVSPFDDTIYEDTMNKTNYYTIVELDIIKMIYDKGGGGLVNYWFRLLNEIDLYYINKTIGELMEITGLSKSTIIRYNDLLMESKAIYIHKYGYRFVDSKKTLSNIYGLYENKDIIDKIADDYINTNNNKIETIGGITNEK